MTLMGDFDFNYLAEIDRLMAQILCGSYFALAGVVCMNLYIALLSDTFARVYAQAQANAVMQLAQSVILLESKLGKEKRLKVAHYLQDECSPEVNFYIMKRARSYNKDTISHCRNICSKPKMKALDKHPSMQVVLASLLLLEQKFVNSIMHEICCKLFVKTPDWLDWGYLALFLQ